RGERGGDAVPDPVGQVDRFETDFACAEFAQGLGDRLGAARAGAVGDDLVVWGLLLGLAGRTRVGQQERLVASDDQVAGRVARGQVVTGVAAQVVARLGLGDQ